MSRNGDKSGNARYCDSCCSSSLATCGLQQYRPCCKIHVANDEEQRGPQSWAFLDLFPFLDIFSAAAGNLVKESKAKKE